MENAKLKEILELSFDEKLELVHKLWDNISEEPEKLYVPLEHITELKKRLKSIEDGTTKFIPWTEARKRFESK